MADIFANALSQQHQKPQPPPDIFAKALNATHTMPEAVSMGQHLRDMYSHVMHTAAAPLRAADAFLGTGRRAVIGGIEGGLENGPQGIISGAQHNMANPDQQEKVFDAMMNHIPGYSNLSGWPKAAVRFAVETGLDPVSYIPIAGWGGKAENIIKFIGEHAPEWAKGNAYVAKYIEQPYRATYDGISLAAKHRMESRMTPAAQHAVAVKEGTTTPEQVISEHYFDSPIAQAALEKFRTGDPAKKIDPMNDHMALFNALRAHEEDVMYKEMAQEMLEKMPHANIVRDNRFTSIDKPVSMADVNPVKYTPKSGGGVAGIKNSPKKFGKPDVGPPAVQQEDPYARAMELMTGINPRPATATSLPELEIGSQQGYKHAAPRSGNKLDYSQPTEAYKGQAEDLTRLAKAIEKIKPEYIGRIPIITDIGDALSRLTRSTMFSNPFPHMLGNVLPLTYLAGGLGTVGKALGYVAKGAVTKSSGLSAETAEKMAAHGADVNMSAVMEHGLEDAAGNPVAEGLRQATKGANWIQQKLVSNTALNLWENAHRGALWEHFEKKYPGMDPYEIAKRVREGVSDYESVPKYVRYMQHMGGVFPQYHNYIVPTAVGRSLIRNPERFANIARATTDVNDDVIKDKNKFWSLGGATSNFARMFAAPTKHLTSPSSIGTVPSLALNANPVLGISKNAITGDTSYQARHPGEAVMDQLAAYAPGGLDKLLHLHALITGKPDTESTYQTLFEAVTGAYPNSTYEDQQRIAKWIWQNKSTDLWDPRNRPTSNLGLFGSHRGGGL